MQNFKLFIELTRINKPIGFMLLFWPCLWGLTLAYDFSTGLEKFIFYLILFLSGSILMRSAGCIVNDIADKNFDKLVERTKNRPIASGKISIKQASIYAFILCLIAFLVLINFFNYGLILAWISITNEISLVPIIFYLGAIFWTLGYDTIYGYQDINDDEIIGVKSTSIKFKNNPKKFISFCYFMFIGVLILLGLIMDFNILYFLFLIIPIVQLVFFQVYKLEVKQPFSCLLKFKSNNFLGLLVFTNLLIGKIF